MGVHIERLATSGQRDWDVYVARRDDSTAYHLRAWTTAAARAYGLETPSLLARGADGAVRGVLPLFFVRNALARYGTTGAFGGYGTVLADDAAARDALLAAATRLADEAGLRYLVHKSVGGEPELPGFLPAGASCVTAVLLLESDPEAQWHRFRPEIRNRIRKAERAGLRARRGPDGLVPFYAVLAVNMHRKGTPVYGLRFLRELVAALGERAEIVTLWQGGTCVSGALVVFHQGTVTVPFVSSLPSAFPLAPNNLLYWEVVRLAIGERGARALDFGRSFAGSSNLTFKTRWGAREVAEPWYVYSASGARPTTDARSPRVQHLVRLWQNLPLAVANTLGPAVCGRVLI